MILPCESVCRFSFSCICPAFFQRKPSINGILGKLTVSSTSYVGAQLTRITGVSQKIRNNARAKREKQGKYLSKLPEPGAWWRRTC